MRTELHWVREVIARAKAIAERGPAPMRKGKVRHASTPPISRVDEYPTQEVGRDPDTHEPSLKKSRPSGWVSGVGREP